MAEKLKGVSGSEVSQMLNDCAWREVKTESESKDRQSLMKEGYKSRCVQVESKSLRRILAKLKVARRS